jgi:hypothetical protein
MDILENVLERRRTRRAWRCSLLLLLAKESYQQEKREVHLDQI